LEQIAVCKIQKKGAVPKQETTNQEHKQATTREITQAGSSTARGHLVVSSKPVQIAQRDFTVRFMCV
jgi:hypothetical protein